MFCGQERDGNQIDVKSYVTLVLLMAYASATMGQLFLFHVVLIRKMKAPFSIRLKDQDKR